MRVEVGVTLGVCVGVGVVVVSSNRKLSRSSRNSCRGSSSNSGGSGSRRSRRRGHVFLIGGNLSSAAGAEGGDGSAA